MKRLYRMEEEELAAAEAMGTQRVPPEPRVAAGVILARDRADGPEVLLLRRRPDVGFAAGAYVFPGGTLDEEDEDADWERWLVPPSADTVAGAADPDGPSARTFVIAALREMFEETGVLLSVGEGPPSDVLAAERDALVAGRRRFLDIVAQHGVRLAGDHLVLCARWITPESLSRRYDARFFLAEAPAGAEVVPEAGELVEHVWLRPADALELYFDHRFPMLFPTAKTLGWLEAGRSVAEWFERFRGVRVTPLLPRLRRIEGGAILPVLPGEPRYDEREGDG